MHILCLNNAAFGIFLLFKTNHWFNMLLLHSKHNSIRLKRLVDCNLPTAFGNFQMIAFGESETDNSPHFALVHNEIDKSNPVMVRIHSECLTGDLLGSARCDCGEQFHQSLKMINIKKGVLIYLRQEGRGIGLVNKLKAYNLQDEGLNTIDANIHLGFEADERDYNLAILILNHLNITSIDLITNNPEKIEAIDQSEIELHSRIPLIISPQPDNQYYLAVKKEKMGHLF